MDNFRFVQSGPVLIRKSQNSIIKSVLQQPEAIQWSKEDYDNWFSYEVVVKKNTTEYNDIKKLFYSKGGGLKLIKVKRIQNPYLLGEFLLKKEELERNGEITVKRLFHGTKKQFVDDIITDGFDWRKHERSRWGEGVNFTSSAGFASNFSDRNRMKVMILADVLVGKECIGYEGRQLPDEGCDTVVNPEGNVVVKFDDGEYYPAYILDYCRQY